MRLDQLIAPIASAATEPIAAAGAADGAVEIAALAYDSRAVAPGTLFFCVAGERHDGHDFAAQAVRDGAAALVVERPLGLGVPELLVGSVRAAMGPVADTFYGQPSAHLRVVGVTGTNGKTTTTFLLRALLAAAGEECGLLGTVKSVVGGVERPALRTTPEAIDVHSTLRAILDGGERACAMEVSSHALQLGRTDGVRFAAAIFTNLTQDHLDFHGTMEEYFQAKRKLFLAACSTAARPALAVLNVDDPYGRRLAAELPDAVTLALHAAADYGASDVRVGFEGSHVRLRTPAGVRDCLLPLPGRFNVANALAALAATHAMGFDLDLLVAALEREVRVPGRLESVREGQDFAVLVDYAHTPDSLENVLRAARELARGRVVCVFGAGGDRDRAKRPLMGQAAARLADVVLVTSDNPRSEAPQAIVAEIMSGVGGLDLRKTQTVLDRRAAIEQAIALARGGDVVVIAGKGHEQGQELAGGRKVAFDDVAVARQALRDRAARTAGAAA
ncbi:MAG TPA: UDP-N-acetylmuramoyl-L-alanyl-D-glutamate--2,6-diaminopimelate ligase [Solirubrobacteraceae bacterium]|jgi:UDP-N-acetylmuramoyl-L-alanyl-D-glutamate--2,6-diaminopimelate ligase